MPPASSWSCFHGATRLCVLLCVGERASRRGSQGNRRREGLWSKVLGAALDGRAASWQPTACIHTQRGDDSNGRQCWASSVLGRECQSSNAAAQQLWFQASRASWDRSRAPATTASRAGGRTNSASTSRSGNFTREDQGTLPEKTIVTDYTLGAWWTESSRRGSSSRSSSRSSSATCCRAVQRGRAGSAGEELKEDAKTRKKYWAQSTATGRRAT